MHSNLFTNIGHDCWDWPLIVDADDRSCVQTIWVPVDPSDIPIVDSSIYANAVGQASQKG